MAVNDSVVLMGELVVQLISAVVMFSPNISNPIVRRFGTQAVHWNTALPPIDTVLS